MIGATDFVDALQEHGYEFFTGVPCSRLSGPLALLSAEPGRYVAAANEGAALAAAAGARLGGTRSAVLLQNSGLGNLINPLTSLLIPYRIPVLCVVSLRGWPSGTDEPQHRVMGTAGQSILDSCGVPNILLEASSDAWDDALDEADKAAAQGLPFAVMVPGGTVEQLAVESPASGRVSRAAAIAMVVESFVDAAMISTTGYTSRELFAVADRPDNFYMQGSMGHALAIGLGVALRAPSRTVVVLDGDGAALMHLGTMATVGASSAANLVHVVLDNGSYASTGGQPTGSGTVDWAALAMASGYRAAWECSDEPSLCAALAAAHGEKGPALVAIRIGADGTAVPPRASASLPLTEVAVRFEIALDRQAKGAAP